VTVTARTEDAEPVHRSDIPADAREEVVRRHPSGSRARSRWFVGSSLVGWRQFEEDGVCVLEVPIREGEQHGVLYTWSPSGALESAEPWVHGRAHGVARQWDETGTLVGSYEMVRGTGIDLWWHERFDGPGHYLSEARYYVDGELHGFEWWIREDQESLDEECHWLRSRRHGIHRMWRGLKLDHGFPKFLVDDEEVGRGAYEATRARDPALLVYREADDRPSRTFPEEVRRALRRPGRPG